MKNQEGKACHKKETSICNRGICRCECSCLCDSGNPWKYGKFGVYGKNGGGLAAICEAGRILETVYSYFYAFGFEHILNNMLVLICAGPILEKAMGHIKYLCLYLIAGVGGSTLSYVQMIARGKYDVSAGASGAISVLSGHCCGL